MTQETSSLSFPPADNSDRSRIFFLDVLKAVSISAVVFYHSVFFPIDTYFSVAIPELVLSSPLRFCVPVLLTISFFLFERELSKVEARPPWSICRKRLFRIAIPVGFWFGIAIFIQLIKGNSLLDLFREVLTGNIYIGAYFLLILLQLTPVYVLVRLWFKQKRNVLIAIVLQAVVFIMIKFFTFHAGAFGEKMITVLSYIERPFFIYWFVYMALGYFLYHHLSEIVNLSSLLSVRRKILITLIASACMALEYANLIPNVGSRFYVFEYALLACIASVLVAFVCLASIEEKKFPKALVLLTQFLSRYSLGIFCINGILSQGLSLLAHHFISGATFNLLEVLAARLLGWLILIITSLVISIWLSKIGLQACVR